MEQTEKAVFGGGCFWCTEAVFKRLRGVLSVTPGYTGGAQDDASYDQVSMGGTGHVESIQIVFNPNQISYQDLLNVFFGSHDPTTIDRQGNDVGDMYRSVIFTTTAEQQAAARAMIKQLTNDQVFSNPIVTAVEPLTTFYPAEDYHRDYYDKNPQNPYCQVVISPKIAKLRQKFSHLLKDA